MQACRLGTTRLLYEEHDALALLKARAEKALPREARNQREWRLLKTCPGLGPIRTAELLPVVHPVGRTGGPTPRAVPDAGVGSSTRPARRDRARCGCTSPASDVVEVILVDTSIWVDHLRAGDNDLATALERGLVFTHPFIVGELACWRMRNRREVLRLLQSLPRSPVATDGEALRYIEVHNLMGQGLGYVDVHLLASVALSGAVRLWTRDRRLAEVAAELGVVCAPSRG